MENKEFEDRFACLTDQELNMLTEMAWHAGALKAASLSVPLGFNAAPALKAAAQMYFLAQDTREGFKATLREKLRISDPARNSDGMPIDSPF